MKRIISGILRIVLALVTDVVNLRTLHRIKAFENFHLMNSGQKTGEILIFIFLINFTIYMTVNAIMDFKNRAIKFKAMYILFFIDISFSMFKLFPLQKVPLWWGILMVIYILTALFFVINEFIYLWFKHPKKVSN
jgi:hypothetical protein